MMKQMVLATAASLALVFAASSAHAGGPSSTTVALTSQVPNPSTTGQSVTLGVTVTPTTNTFNTCAANVTITDTTGGGNVAVCTAAVSGPNGQPATGSCSYAFPTPGTRSLALNFAGNGNVGAGCLASSGTGSQVVNGAAAVVPTLGEWAMWGFAGALMLGGAAFLARRAQHQLSI